MEDISKDIIVTDIDKIDLDENVFKKMIFIYNTLENGWSVRKKENSYVFTKKHENKKEVYSSDFIRRFMKRNFLKKII
tara:strand:+ start:213 stop:446 length:234 start_codon:yes stop_codon:yes gene_type:complete